MVKKCTLKEYLEMTLKLIKKYEFKIGKDIKDWNDKERKEFEAVQKESENLFKKHRMIKIN